MIRELTCIGCPMGCSLTVEVEDGTAVSVSGNTCGIGKKYAEQEVSSPQRMVTTTILTAEGIPVPVKTAAAVPKDMIFAVMEAVKSAELSLPARRGDIAVRDAAGTGIDVIVTADKG